MAIFFFQNSFKKKRFCHDLSCSKTISFGEHKAYKEPLIFCFISPVRKAVTTLQPRPCQPSRCQSLQASSAAMVSSIMSTPGFMRLARVSCTASISDRSSIFTATILLQSLLVKFFIILSLAGFFMVVLCIVYTSCI